MSNIRFSKEDLAEDQEPSEPDSTEEKPPRSIAEQVSFAIAALILATLIGFVCYLWLGKREQSPPNPVVTRPQSTQKLSGQFHVPFELTNQGDSTAEAVQVIAELRINGEVIETGEQQFDFLSSQETESGTFIFSRDPKLGELTVRVASYKHP
jgi:uncharacterized protein (TIGR02588 family)